MRANHSTTCQRADSSMKKRKPNNMKARIERSCRALLRSNHVAVVSIDPTGRQGLVNWKSCKSIPPGKAIADAVCDIAHHWTIYLSAMCEEKSGVRYLKSIEIAPQGMYRAEHLTDAIEANYRGLIAECNPNHVVASGWIAIPADVSLEVDQAAKVFSAVGAWDQKRAA